MYTKLTFAIVLIFSLLPLKSDKNVVICQDNKITKVIYTTNNTYKNQNSSENKKSEFIESLNENQQSIEFELFFNNDASLFRVIDKMDKQNDKKYKIAVIISGGTKIFYRNNLTKEKLYQAELKGQVFNVKTSFEEYKWQIENEVKIINGFKCYKAKCVINKIDKAKNTSRILNPTVWFTPEIPASFGPYGMDGLPGLVLEGTVDGVQYFYAKKIISDDKALDVIKRPSKAVEVNEDDFGNINKDFYQNANPKRF